MASEHNAASCKAYQSSSFSPKNPYRGLKDRNISGIISILRSIISSKFVLVPTITNSIWNQMRHVRVDNRSNPATAWSWTICRPVRHADSQTTDTHIVTHLLDSEVWLSIIELSVTVPITGELILVFEIIPLWLSWWNIPRRVSCTFYIQIIHGPFIQC